MGAEEGTLLSVTDDVPGDLPMPLPVVDKGANVPTEVFGEAGPQPTTPVGAAYMWWLALDDPTEYRNALTRLTVDINLWGDFSDALDALADRSITSFPIMDETDPGVAHVKFINYAGEGVGQFFDHAELDDIVFLTLVLNEHPGETHGWWRVWGLSTDGGVPYASVVRGSS